MKRIREELAKCFAHYLSKRPDREGAMRGIEDWLMEEAMIALELKEL